MEKKPLHRLKFADVALCKDYHISKITSRQYFYHLHRHSKSMDFSTYLRISVFFFLFVCGT